MHLLSLQRMRRGYTREAYIQLIDDVRALIPDVAITSDFITGFCGETEEEHKQTLSLMEYVRYDLAFMFAYSMRGKTKASRTMIDDVPENIKSRRLQEVIDVFRTNIQHRNDVTEVGKLRLVLVEGESRKSKEGSRRWSGRTDQNKRIIFPSNTQIPTCLCEEEIHPIIRSTATSTANPANALIGEIIQSNSNGRVQLKSGDYAVVRVDEARGHTLSGTLMWRATMQGFDSIKLLLTEDILGMISEGAMSENTLKVKV